MSDSRIIKKYPNRRLYDTGISSYIRLDDVQKLVSARTPIQVVDQRTGADITQAILMQTLALIEERQPQLLETSTLLELIRRHGTDEAPETAAKLARSIAA